MKRKIKVLEKVESCAKDWRHAFLEVGIIEEKNMSNYLSGMSNYLSGCMIKISQRQTPTKYLLIFGYISLFKYGGIWYEIEGLFLTTNINKFVDDEATYEDAKTYIAERS